MSDVETYLNPTKFHEMLAAGQQEAAEAEGDEEAGAELGEEAGHEEEFEEEQEQASEHEEGEEEQEPEDEAKPQKGSIPPAVLRREKEARREQEARANRAEAERDAERQKTDAIYKWMEQQAKGGQPEEAVDEYEPLDEEADKRTKQALKKIEDQLTEDKQQREQEREQLQFSSYVTTASQVGAKEFPDFDQAYDHFMVTKAKEAALMHGDEEMGQEVAIRLATAIARKMMVDRKTPQEVARQFYEIAKANGYKPKVGNPTVGKGLNPEAIERNRAKGGKRPTESAEVSGLNGKTVDEAVRKMSVLGKGVDPKAFQKMLASLPKPVA